MGLSDIDLKRFIPESTFGRLVFAIISCLLLIYLFLLGASSVYINPGHELKNLNDLWSPILKAHLPSWVPVLKYIPVERLNGLHALRNIVTIACTTGLVALSPIVVAILGIVVTVYGLFTADCSGFISGILVTILLAPLSLIAVLIVPFYLWFILLLSPSCTTNYTILLICVGLPFILLGLATGAVPTYSVIVIFIEN